MLCDRRANVLQEVHADGARLYCVHAGDSCVLKEEEDKGILDCIKLPSAAGGPEIVKDV